MIKVRLDLTDWTAPTPELTASNGKKAVTVELGSPATIHDLFVAMAVKYPALLRDIYNIENRQINERINIFINGEFIIPANITRRKLNDGDMLTLLPVLAGG